MLIEERKERRASSSNVPVARVDGYVLDDSKGASGIERERRKSLRVTTRSCGDDLTLLKKKKEEKKTRRSREQRNGEEGREGGKGREVKEKGIMENVHTIFSRTTMRGFSCSHSFL